MEGVAQQLPVEGAALVPLAEVGQLVAHEIQLLARVGVHIQVEGPQLAALFLIGAPQLLDDGPLAVDHLVVAEGQQVELVVEVLHAEQQLAVLFWPLPEGGGEIVEGVVHPPHVPLVVEAHPVVAGGGGDLEVVGRVLGDGEGGGPALVQPVVQPPQKVERALVHPAGGVPQPVDGPGHRVHPDAVAVVDLQPEGGGAVQKAAHLPAVVVEVAGAPLAAADVAVVLVQAGAVQPGQTGGVGGKVDRHKVHDYPDAHPVAGVDQPGELRRAAVPAGRGEVAGGLVAPAAVKGVLGQRQQLEMGEVVLGQPGDQLPREVVVVVPPVRPVGGRRTGLVLPAAGVQLVDVDRQVVPLGAAGHPLAVVKGEGQAGQPAGGAGPQLAPEGVGVGVQLGDAVRPGDAVLVAVPLLRAGRPRAPEAGVVFGHGQVGAVLEGMGPVGAAQADRHRPRPRRKEDELPAGLAFVPGGGVGAHPAVGVKAGAVPKALRDGRVDHGESLLVPNFYLNIVK